MKKKYLWNLLALFMTATCLCTLLTSCGDDEIIQPQTEITNSNNGDNNGDNNQGQAPNTGSQDPEGTITMNMRTGSNDNNFYDIGLGSEIGIDASNNWKTKHITGSYSSPFGGSTWDYHVEYVSVGTVNGLGYVSSVPSAGWGESVAVIPGTGYVVKDMNGKAFTGTYSRIYVVEQTSDGQSFTIKYQTPFEVIFAAEASSVTLSQTYVPAGEMTAYHPAYDAYYYYSGSVKLNFPNRVEISEKPEWCYASITYGEKSDGTLTISTSSQPTSTNERRTGTIVLKNSVCKIEIEVILPQHE